MALPRQKPSNDSALPFVPYQLPTGVFSGLALCGEAPGANEVIMGRPFTGRSGKVLDEVLAALGIGRENVMVVNVFRYRPPENHVGEFFASKRSGLPIDESYGKYGSGFVKAEYAGELAALAAALKEHKPRAIVALGRTPLWAFTGYNGPMTPVRGQLQENRLVPSIPVMPSWHPSFIIRGKWSEKDVLKGDIENAMKSGS